MRFLTLTFFLILFGALLLGCSTVEPIDTVSPDEVSVSYSESSRTVCAGGSCQATFYSAQVYSNDTGEWLTLPQMSTLSWSGAAGGWVFERGAYSVTIKPYIVLNDDSRLDYGDVKSGYPNIVFAQYSDPYEFNIKFAFTISNLTVGQRNAVKAVDFEVTDVSGLTWGDVQRTANHTIVVKEKYELNYNDLVNAGFVLSRPENRVVRVTNLSAGYDSGTNTFTFDPDVRLWIHNNTNAEDSCQLQDQPSVQGGNLATCDFRDGNSNERTGFFIFNTTDIPTTATITNADLMIYFYLETMDPGEAYDLQAYGVVNDWECASNTDRWSSGWWSSCLSYGEAPFDTNLSTSSDPAITFTNGDTIPNWLNLSVTDAVTYAIPYGNGTRIHVRPEVSGGTPATNDFLSYYLQENEGQGAQYMPQLFISYTEGGGDSDPPVITNVVNYSLTNQSFSVNWTTDENSNSSVNYGTDTSLGSIVGQDDSVQSHNVNVTSLINSTLYYYNVTSCDSSGNCNNSGPYQITTNGNPDLTAPTISNVVNYSITNESASVNWTTNEASNTTINYGTDESLGTYAGQDDNVTSHNYNFTSLINSTTYYYNVTSCDSYDNCETDGPYYFTTDGNPDLQAPVISAVVNYSITNQSASVNWTTNEASNTTLQYGIDESLGTWLGQDDNLTSHNVNITSLINNTLYYYNVTSCDSYDNCATDGPYSFTTLQNAAETFEVCTVISTPGSYTLTNNVYTNTTETDESFCFNITASDVNFDCNGYGIYGNGSFLLQAFGPGRAVGINVQDADNVTVQNCRANNLSQVVFLNNVNNSVIENIIMTAYPGKRTDYILYANNSHYNTFRNYDISDTEIAVGIYYDSSDNNVSNVTVKAGYNSAHTMIVSAYRSNRNYWHDIVLNVTNQCILIYNNSNYNRFDNLNCTGVLNDGITFLSDYIGDGSYYNNFTNVIVSVDSSSDYAVKFSDQSYGNRFVDSRVYGNKLDVQLYNGSYLGVNPFYTRLNVTGNVSWYLSGGTWHMSNDTTGAIVIATNVTNLSSIPGGFVTSERKLYTWQTDALNWKDKPSTGETQYTYHVTGLSASTDYTVFNGSSVYSYLTTNENGALPVFNINVSNSFDNNITISQGITDSIIPSVRNYGSNQSTVNQTASLILYSEGYDDGGLNSAWYATNETGTWVNWTNLTEEQWSYYSAGSYFITQAAFGDVLGDFGSEVAVADYFNDRVKLLNSTGDLQWTTDITTENCYNNGYTNDTTSVSFGDIYGNGVLALGVTADNGCAYLLNATDGSIIWSYSASNVIDDLSIIATEVRVDEGMLAFVGSNTGLDAPGYLIVLDANGNHLWNHTYSCFGDSYSYDVAIGDVNGDGDNDVAYVACDQVMVFNSTGGSLWNYTLPDTFSFGVEIGNVTDDGFNEVVATTFGTGNSTVALIDYTGSSIWNYTLSGAQMTGKHARIADFKSNYSGEEIAVGTWYNDSIVFLNASGYNFDNLSTADHVWGLQVGQLGYDSSVYDLVYGSYDESVYVVRYNGKKNLFNAQSEWRWSNFTWSNDYNITGTVAWRIYYEDASGNVNATPEQTFAVLAPPVVQDGSLTVSLVSPTGNDEWTQNEYSTFIVNVSCSGGFCGNATAYLDPILGSETVGGSQSVGTVDFIVCTPKYTAPSSGTVTNASAYVYQSVPTATFKLGVYSVSGSTYTLIEDTDETTTTDASPTLKTVNLQTSQSISSGTDYSLCFAGNGNSGIAYETNADGVYSAMTWPTMPTSFTGTTYSAHNFSIYSFYELSSTANKTGLIPEFADWDTSYAFYTNGTNPSNGSDYSCLLNMDDGHSCRITWYVNSTGENGTSYEFFAYANSTVNSTTVNSSIINITILSTPAADTCTCPGDSSAHEFDFSDNCVITSCIAGDITFTGTGSLTWNGSINITGMTPPPNGQTLILGSLARVLIG